MSLNNFQEPKDGPRLKISFRGNVVHLYSGRLGIKKNNDSMAFADKSLEIKKKNPD